MNSCQSPCKKSVVDYAHALLIDKIGFATLSPVDYFTVQQYRQWIAGGCHGEMAYLEKYLDIRDNPALLLSSARTIIVCAINYTPATRQCVGAPEIAPYAYGRDYHEVIREKLTQVADFIKSQWGGETRVCVDTAPLRERYWAQRAGVGFIGKNSQLILPGRGSRFFLGEILTSIEFEPDEPCVEECLNCGKCMEICPGGAIVGNNSIDARKCISYLTIEYRGEFDASIKLGNRLYGCDECQNVCPHNLNAIPTQIPEFQPTEALLKLNRDDIREMTPMQFSEMFRHSAIKRTKLSGLQRNEKHLE